MKKIDISQLDEYYNKFNCIITGSPKGVGFSTYISEVIAQEIFFNDSFSAIVLTEDNRSKIDLLFKIKKAYNFYGLDLKQDENTLYTQGEKGAGVCVINYDEYLLESIDIKQNLIVVDRDDTSNRLYEQLANLIACSDKLIFNTYDLPHSIFYNIDVSQFTDIESTKIILTSKYSKEYINKTLKKESNIINQDRIIIGEFKTEI